MFCNNILNIIIESAPVRTDGSGAVGLKSCSPATIWSGAAYVADAFACSFKAAVRAPATVAVELEREAGFDCWPIVAFMPKPPPCSETAEGQRVTAPP